MYDVSLLAELLELLILLLELMVDEAASLGLEVTVKDHEVAVAEEFVLSRLPHSFLSPKHP